MTEGNLERQSRRLAPFTIDGRPVFARKITNDDLERKDEMDDEIAELQLLHAKLVGRNVTDGDGDRAHLPGEVDDCEDPEERKRIRAEARAIAKKLRDLDALQLRLYVEDENGESFSEDVVKAIPIRDQTRLGHKATSYAFGVEDEDGRPTPARTASG